jgi:predicted amidophosphoribosyltransferase
MDMAFKAVHTDPETVLLVDDMLTTGSTTDACAYCLRENGAQWIGVVTLAAPKMNKKYR